MIAGKFPDFKKLAKRREKRREKIRKVKSDV